MREGGAQLLPTRQQGSSARRVQKAEPTHGGGRWSCDGEGVAAGLARAMHADLGQVQRLLGLARLGLLLLELLRELDNFRFGVNTLVSSHRTQYWGTRSRRWEGNSGAGSGGGERVRDGIAHLESLLPPAANGPPWLSDMKAHLSSTNWRMSANICGRARETGEWPPIACSARTPGVHGGGVLSVHNASHGPCGDMRLQISI